MTSNYSVISKRKKIIKKFTASWIFQIPCTKPCRTSLCIISIWGIFLILIQIWILRSRLMRLGSHGIMASLTFLESWPLIKLQISRKNFALKKFEKNTLFVKLINFLLIFYTKKYFVLPPNERSFSIELWDIDSSSMLNPDDLIVKNCHNFLA